MKNFFKTVLFCGIAFFLFENAPCNAQMLSEALISHGYGISRVTVIEAYDYNGNPFSVSDNCSMLFVTSFNTLRPGHWDLIQKITDVYYKDSPEMAPIVPVIDVTINAYLAEIFPMGNEEEYKAIPPNVKKTLYRLEDRRLEDIKEWDKDISNSTRWFYKGKLYVHLKDAVKKAKADGYEITPKNVPYGLATYINIGIKYYNKVYLDEDTPVQYLFMKSVMDAVGISESDWQEFYRTTYEVYIRDHNDYDREFEVRNYFVGDEYGWYVYEDEDCVPIWKSDYVEHK